jgi:multidrug efflux pump subunit AcrB
MVTIINFLIKKKLLINLFVCLLLGLGLFSLNNLNREAYPEVNFDMVSIKTIYPGGSSDEIEQLITIPIEKKLREINGLDKVRSYSIENISVIAIYIEETVSDKAEVVQDIKDAVDLVEDLPDKAESPLVEEIKLDKTEVIHVALYATKEKTSYRKIRDTADQLEDFLYEIKGIAEVEDFGFYDQEILLEVNSKALEKNRLGMNNLIDTLRVRNIDLPGGSLKIKEDEFVVRTKGQYDNTREIKETVIMANDRGFATKVKDVAKVINSYEEAKIYERYNGHAAIIFSLWKKKNADEIDTVNQIRKAIAQFNLRKPKDIKIELFDDSSENTKRDIKSVATNAATGFILLAFILFFFLGWRMSLLVTSLIPLVFMIAFTVLSFLGETINVISLFGMIMVLGMIVDFGIVVSENSYRYLATGLEKTTAIQKGVSELVWPVTITFLCICTAFAPLLFLTGLIGKFVYLIPMVLIICLGGSWFLALFVLPSFLDLVSKTDSTKKDSSSQEDKLIEDNFFGKIQLGYRYILDLSLKYRYITVLILLLLFGGSLALFPIIGFEFYPGGGSKKIQIKTKLAPQKNLKANLKEIKKLEQVIQELPETELVSLYSRVGIEEADGLDPKPGEGTYKSTINLYLTPESKRDRIAAEINKDLRDRINLAQKNKIISKDIKIKAEVLEDGPPIGKPVNIEIRGEDFKVISKIAGEYIDYLKKIDGVNDISMDLETGKEEYRYKIDEVMAARARVSVYDIAMALNSSFEGAVATSIRKGDESIDLRVRFPEKSREKLSSLNQVMIANRMGGLIPLDRVTKVKKKPGFSKINRLNFKRLVQVQAEVDPSKITSLEVNSRLARDFKNIGERFPDYPVAYGGEQEDTNKSMGQLGTFFSLALFVIYMILAVFLDSLILPIVVMIGIPFSLVGVALALLFHGEPLSFMSVLGIFSLAGVIVSNTLVLVEFINNKRNEGSSLKEALLQGGVLRLKPVILTTGTTVLALLPTIYGVGDKNYFVAPLALSFGYGLIFASVITLFLVPCFYNIAEDYKKGLAKLFGFFGLQLKDNIIKNDK